MFKRDSLVILVDVGILRSHKDLSMGMDLIPHLIGQVELEHLTKQRTAHDLDEIVEFTTKNAADKHKQSILNEHRRLKALEDQRLKVISDKIEATRVRK